MTSILKVNNIQSSASNAAATIASSGAVTFPQAVTFSGTVTGDNNGWEKVSSSTSTQAGLTNLQITLPTTTDFIALKLIVRGIKSTTATNSYWGFSLGNASGTAITASSSYYYLGSYTYSNNSSHGDTYLHSFGDVFGRMSAHYLGDGSADDEMTDMELDIYLSNEATRSTRVNYRLGYEKRHTDAYVTVNQGSVYRNGAEVNANINIFSNTGTAFTSYGYGLYKVKT